ncbi:MAG TPA: hypothetical protein VK585_00850 [Jiangellaceae bacterium]|nr:hypothetical protein [Jiangellaceae bacterium]
MLIALSIIGVCACQASSVLRPVRCSAVTAFVVHARCGKDEEGAAEASVSLRDGISPSEAQHVWQAAREDANRLAEAPQRGGIRHRRERTDEVLDLHEVGANRSNPLEVLGDLVHGVGQSGIAASIEILGEKHVFGDLHGALQQPMDEDDVDADQLSSALDLLSRDLSYVRDELQLQVAGPGTTIAGAQVQLDQTPLGVEGPVHGHGSLGGFGDRCGAIQRSSLAEEERGVAFDLDQVEVAGGIDHPLEQTCGCCLGVSEAQAGAVEAHVFGVAADVGDQEKRAARVHSEIIGNTETTEDMVIRSAPDDRRAGRSGRA